MMRQGRQDAICETCNRIYQAYPCQLKNGRRFCSRPCIRGRPRSAFDRMMERVTVGGPDECWPYHGGSTSARSGHRQVWEHGKMRQAHRIAWEHYDGPIPDGMKVLHKCDNPPCVNRAHLFLGTISDNNADRDAKGRHVRLNGESNGVAKLTESKVREIRDLCATRQHPQAKIAQMYGVNQALISAIHLRKAWAHVE